MRQARASSSSVRASSNGERAERPLTERGDSTAPSADGSATTAGVGEDLTSLVEQLINRIFTPLDLVILNRELIQATLDEAADHGRVTRADANELVAELVRRGRQQTEEVLRRARHAEPLDQPLRVAGRPAAAEPSLPISGYDELTASQVLKELAALTPAQLRRLRDYEVRHANRKSVLEAIDKALA